MRSPVLAVVVLCLSVAPALTAQGQGSAVVREDRKHAADGVTEGWVLTYDNPDPDRSSERIPGTLVIARHGTIVRRWQIQTVRNWIFWDGGKEVAVEWGGLHFGTHCYLASVRTGRKVASYPGWCGEADAHAPTWVKALQGIEQPSPQ